MKMNKDELRALKARHRIELLMQEAGEAFEVDAKNSDVWRSTITYGLTVDIRRQTYEINLPIDCPSGSISRSFC
jgi:hypothetical protein